MRNQHSRRNFIRQVVASGLPVLSAGLWAGSCQSKTTAAQDPPKTTVDPCTDFSAASETDLQTRKKLGYTPKSPRSESKCGNCNLWLPPKGGQSCGGCMLFKGPVFTDAYCTYWAPQAK